MSSNLITRLQDKIMITITITITWQLENPITIMITITLPNVKDHNRLRLLIIALPIRHSKKRHSAYCWAPLYRLIVRPHLEYFRLGDIIREKTSINWKACNGGKREWDRSRRHCYEERLQRFNLTTFIVKNSPIRSKWSFADNALVWRV